MSMTMTTSLEILPPKPSVRILECFGFCHPYSMEDDEGLNRETTGSRGVPDVEKDDLNDLVENPTMETVDSSEDDEDEVSLNDNDELQKHLGASETAQRIKLLQLTEKVGQAVTIWDSDEQFESFCGSISPAPVVQTTSPRTGLFQEMGRALTLWESEEQFDSFRASISPAISPTSAPNTSLMQRQ